MGSEKEAVIARLRKELLSMQGFRSASGDARSTQGPGFMNHHFPGNCFPVGAIHEFIVDDKGATSGFLAGILSSLLARQGVCIWISTSRTLFPPALCAFGIIPDTIIFIELQKEKDLLWAIEESLKCDGLAAVVGEIKELSFTASRRLQLAVEQSRVTGFLLRQQIKNTSVAVTRWNITSIPSQPADGIPGVGFPRWHVELLKVRNGKPGRWNIEWHHGQFHLIPDVAWSELIPQKKTG